MHTLIYKSEQIIGHSSRFLRLTLQRGIHNLFIFKFRTRRVYTSTTAHKNYGTVPGSVPASMENVRIRCLHSFKCYKLKLEVFLTLSKAV